MNKYTPVLTSYQKYLLLVTAVFTALTATCSLSV